MPTVQHVQPPPEDTPPPSRRDHETPAAGHHGPNDRLRDAWLAEMWPVCPEYHPGDQPRPYRTAA